MALNKRNFKLITTLNLAAAVSVSWWAYASADTIPQMLTAGYFNDLRDRLSVNDRLDLVGSASGIGDFLTVRIASVPASGNVLVVTDDDQASVGSARAVVPTANGLTTGLILASDNFVTLAAADANHWATLPAIADVPLGKEIWAKNGATACELRTPATSATKINNGQADANEAVIAANTSVFIKKTAPDNWLVLTYVGGAVACPTPD